MKLSIAGLHGGQEQKHQENALYFHVSSIVLTPNIAALFIHGCKPRMVWTIWQIELCNPTLIMVNDVLWNNCSEDYILTIALFAN